MPNLVSPNNTPHAREEPQGVWVCGALQVTLTVQVLVALMHSPGRRIHCIEGTGIVHLYTCIAAGTCMGLYGEKARGWCLASQTLPGTALDVHLD
jgi:hypothetical protein